MAMESPHGLPQQGTFTTPCDQGFAVLHVVRLPCRCLQGGRAQAQSAGSRAAWHSLATLPEVLGGKGLVKR